MTLPRRILLALATLPALLAPSCGSEPDVEPGAPPEHVLFVLIDTLRASHLSCYGYRRLTSPNIDQLARAGVLFEHCTAQSSWTAPSMVSMFTGRYLSDERMSIPAETPSLPELFQRAGYRTGAFVVNPILHNEENGFRRGFDLFETKAGFKRVAGWIAKSAGQKTFTYVHWVDPHDPYGPEEAYQRFLLEGGGLGPRLAAYYDRVTRERNLARDRSSREAVGRAIDGYDDDIRLVDSKVDILVGALREVGLLDRSVVVIASDHGEGLFKRPHYPGMAEPLDEETEEELSLSGPTLLSTHKMTHGNQLYDELVHVPLIFHAPAFARRVVVNEHVENVDILPTLLEMANIPAPRGLSGRSLLPLMRGTDQAEPATTGVTVTRWVRSIRTPDGLKLILPTDAGFEKGLEPELYHVARDPDERENAYDEFAAKGIDLSIALEEALRRALPGETEISDANRDAMEALGYVAD